MNRHLVVLAVLATVLALAVLAIAPWGAGESGAGRGPVPAAVDGPPPVARSGPDGRVALRGPWTVRGDRAGRGSALGWSGGGFTGRVVDVPFSPNARSVRGPQGALSFAGSVAWYRTGVVVHRAGDYAIRFESVNHRASVWVDGRPVARHTGTYLPFEARVRLGTGAHTLVVRADWRDPQAMKAAAWHRTWFNFGGINREVTIRPLGAVELDAPALTTRLRGTTALVTVSVEVRNRGAARRFAVRGVLGRDGGRTSLRFPAVSLAPGASTRVQATVPIPHPALWAPGRPALYDLELQAPGASGWRAQVGLRELRQSAGRLLLNGRPVRLRGASLQEDAPGRGDALTPADMDAIVSRLKAIGANATRSQHPLNPALLERLDAAGILVWQGVGPVDAPGAWTSNTPALRARARRRVRLNVLQARMHPSIVAWNLANEVAGNGHAGGQAEYVDSMAQALHRLDPGRLVAVDVWGTHLPAVAGLMYRHVDAVGATNYDGWYQDTFAPGPVVSAAIRGWLAQLEAVFPSKVLVVSEFGAEANALNAPAAPGGQAFQSRLLARHIGVYRTDPRISGMLVWNLQDFALAPSFAGGSIRRQVPHIALVRGLNQKGLFTYGGRPKPAVAVVRRLFAAG
jgi:beta-galactosidase/beta-glucuronidase